jgi:hypothetical protein
MPATRRHDMQQINTGGGGDGDDEEEEDDDGSDGRENKGRRSRLLLLVAVVVRNILGRAWEKQGELYGICAANREMRLIKHGHNKRTTGSFGMNGDNRLIYTANYSPLCLFSRRHSPWSSLSPSLIRHGRTFSNFEI